MELINITYSGEGKQPIELTPSDSQLVTSNFINSNFGATDDYMELFISDQSGQLLDQDYDAFDYYPFLLNNPQNNTFSALTLDPERDLKNRGFNRGSLNAQYNFYKKLFNSEFGVYYWIKEISTSRTELKLASQVIPNQQILDGFNAYQAYISTKNYYPIFYLNFGDNVLVTANNVAYTEDEQGGYLLVKLYEPLPTEFDIKNQLWIIDKVAESVSFDVDIQVQVEDTVNVNRLRGPNFNVRLNTKNGQTTPYYNYNNLLASPVTSSYQKLLSYYQDKSVDINVNYSSFDNFIHWSSAVERVSNFVYKLQLIESSSADLSAQQSIIGGSGALSIASSSIGAIESYIDNIIQNFDPYEYFLYFESSSWAWPKSTSTQPYSLYSVSSSIAKNFLGGVNTIPTPTTQSLLFSASYYDSTNKDLLHNSIPQYLLDDSSNEPYMTFIDMVGQHFDNIWIYYKDISNRYDATNNPETGISLDVVSDALRNFGIQLYTNTNVSDNLYYTLFGINPDGSLLPPTGSEIITNYVTSSLTTLPAQTIQDEIYKRLYHNLPYLLKTKGTERGVKALIATYGIPDSILTVREFGGNFVDGVDGVFDLDTSEYKIAIATGSNGNVTGSLTLSSSLLSPYTTIQYYEKNHRVNSTNIEVGFSPADVINNNISSQGFFSINQLIGKPSDQYSSSYQPLVSASNAYFSTYTQPNSVWEYIRLLKFYNNSIFKLVKDFIPARANVSTGIIVKSHMLERNKYARHEPDVNIENNFSQSIDMVSITGSEAGAISGSTYWASFIQTPNGFASYTSSQNIELYNGEFSGSTIVVTDGNTFNNQSEISSISISGSSFVTYSLGALYQNITESVNSLYFFDLDYNSDQLKPVNYNAVTYSLSQSQIDNYTTYNNPNNPYAQLQDYNYFLKRSIIPRYEGSKIQSATYNVYTDGDNSYGKTAVIDKGKYQYAYLIDIYTSSAYFPGRSNAQIKYLIDNNENILDLTKANTNIFEIQNVFQSQQTCDIGLFKYDEENPYSQLLANNPTQVIYEGGFRYLPMLHNITGGVSVTQSYTLDSPIQITVQGSTTTAPTSSETNPDNYILDHWSQEIDYGGGYSAYFINIRAYFNGPNLSEDVTLQVRTFLNNDGVCGTARTFSVTILQGDTIGFSSQDVLVIPPPAPGQPLNSTGNGSGESTAFASPAVTHWPPTGVTKTCGLDVLSIAGGSTGGGGSTTTFESTFLLSEVTGSPCLYYLSESQEVVFNSTLGYHFTNPVTFNSTSDPSWPAETLERVVIPFSLNSGDKISFFDTGSLGWSENSEYTIKNAYVTGSGITGSRLIAQLDRSLNAAVLSSGSGVPVDPFTGSPFRVCRYIVWKHVPDETNVILRFNPVSPTLTEEGLLFPQYISEIVKQNSGNVIKALRSQNLLPPSP
jgi:hypothetical protein